MATHSAVIAHTVGPYRDSLEVASVPTKTTASDGCLLVAVEAAGLSFPDVLTVEGKHVFKKEAPFVPGAEIAGTVTAVGEGVERFKVGDRVFGCSLGGAITQQAEVQEANAYELPASVPAHLAAGFELNYGTVYHGLIDLGELGEGDNLLVLGASGGVGMAAIDIGKAVGANVIACASTAAKLEACRQAGADELINYTDGPLKDLLKEAGWYGNVNVVFDPVGGSFSEPALRALDWQGRFLVVGFAAGGSSPKTAIPSVPLNLALLNERKVQGVLWGAWKARDGNEGNRRNMAAMMRLLADGKLNPVVSKVCDLDNYMEAFDALMNRKAVGKIIIDPNKGGKAVGAKL